MKARRWLAPVAAAALLVGLVQPATAGAGQLVDLRVLLLAATGDEPSFQAWAAALQREGVPFDTIVANTAPPIDASTLEVDGNHARYQGIVMATGQLIYCDAGGCRSALAAEEFTAIEDYERTFGIRQVDAYTFPGPSYGVDWPHGSGDLGGTTPTLTTEGAAAFPYLAGPVPIDFGAYGYLSTPLGDPNLQAFVEAPDGSPLVGQYTQTDGREVLFATFDSNPYMIQSLLLAHGMIGWLTRGVHLGYWRNSFAVDVDDIFYGDDRWDVDANTTPDPSPDPIRMTPADVQAAVDWQAANGLQFTLMFNGFASDEAVAENGSDPLTEALVANRSAFRWVNHTYQALDLDAADVPTIRGEIRQNLTFATAHGVTVDPHELVTDAHSGLANPNMPAALAAENVTRIGADASRTFDQFPIGPALTVPRYPSGIYYNTGTREEALDEYNYLYYEACVPSSTTTCFTQPATWQDYVGSEASIMLRHIMSNDPRPHYVHQSNLSEDRTLYDVLDEVLARYQTYFSVPLDQPTLTQSGDTLQRQGQWNAALAAGQVTAYELDGHVHLSSTASVSVPTTGIATFTDEAYGAERSGWVSLASGASAVYPTVATLANAAPVAQPGSVTTNRDVPAAASLAATDAEGDSLTYAIVADPAHGTLSGTAPSLTYTPNAGFVGSDQFTFRASDGALDSNVATVSITVVDPATLPSITSFSPTTGRPGTRVTITGVRFNGATSVRFNGVAATFTATRSGTRITTAVPADATTGPITITTPAGTGTSATSFVVLPPLPVITGFTPGSGPVGTLVTISGTGFTGATSVVFQNRPAIFTVVDGGTIRATVPAGARTGRITVVTPAGNARSATAFVVG